MAPLRLQLCLCPTLLARFHHLHPVGTASAPFYHLLFALDKPGRGGSSASSGTQQGGGQIRPVFKLVVLIRPGTRQVSRRLGTLGLKRRRGRKGLKIWTYSLALPTSLGAAGDTQCTRLDHWGHKSGGGPVDHQVGGGFRAPGSRAPADNKRVQQDPQKKRKITIIILTPN